MGRFRFGAMLALVVAVAVVSSGAASAGRAWKSRVVGHVYVNDNTAPVNSVAGFDRHADGSLTAMPGSPFSVGGSGAGARTRRKGSLQLSADGRYLLAVDAGSNQISVLRIRPDGSLESAAVSPVASGGVDPVSIAVDRDLVYVANAGPGASVADTNYTGFRLDAGWTPEADPQLDLRAPERLQARAGPLQPGGNQARRHPDRHLADRQLHRRPPRTAYARSRLAVSPPRRSRRHRARASSAASSAPSTRTNCSSPTRTPPQEPPPFPASSPASSTPPTAASAR